jgi:hypothetical protein
MAIWVCKATHHGIRVAKLKTDGAKGMLMVYKLRHSYLNILTLECYGPMGEIMKLKSLNLTKVEFSVFNNNIWYTKG